MKYGRSGDRIDSTLGDSPQISLVPRPHTPSKEWTGNEANLRYASFINTLNLNDSRKYDSLFRRYNSFIHHETACISSQVRTAL